MSLRKRNTVYIHMCFFFKSHQEVIESNYFSKICEVFFLGGLTMGR